MIYRLPLFGVKIRFYTPYTTSIIEILQVIFVGKALLLFYASLQQCMGYRFRLRSSNLIYRISGARALP